MYSKETTVKNPTGLHARPASEFVAAAKKFRCKVQVKRPDEADAVNAKSIVMLLSKAFCKGDTVQIIADGEGDREAVEALIALVDGGFGEI
ncbi:MAG: HPr family phosphocarrier protein [Christensenellaceae bacterium]|nr:HPr family phosphocarrier protein [Christensenellaceae bacterium]